MCVASLYNTLSGDAGRMVRCSTPGLTQHSLLNRTSYREESSARGGEEAELLCDKLPGNVNQVQASVWPRYPHTNFMPALGSSHLTRKYEVLAKVQIEIGNRNEVS